MNALHLIWIIPVSVWIGFALCAILAVGGNSEKQYKNQNNSRKE